MEPTLDKYEEDQLLNSNLHGAIHSFMNRTACPYAEAKKVVFDLAIDVGLIKPEEVRAFMGHCPQSGLPIKRGMTVTIPKGTMVKTIGKAAKPAGRTYKVTVDHIMEGSNGWSEGRDNTHPMMNPKIVWPGAGTAPACTKCGRPPGQESK